MGKPHSKGGHVQAGVKGAKGGDWNQKGGKAKKGPEGYHDVPSNLAGKGGHMMETHEVVEEDVAATPAAMAVAAKGKGGKSKEKGKGKQSGKAKAKAKAKVTAAPTAQSARKRAPAPKATPVNPTSAGAGYGTVWGSQNGSIITKSNSNCPQKLSPTIRGSSMG